MLITAIDIEGNIPISHNGINKIHIDVVKPITIIVGANGSGKSSILEELTKSTTTKPTYTKLGSRKITGKYRGNDYELISDFGNTKGAHDLIRNNESLNISGTTTTQIDLCEDHLGLTPVIDKLINFRYKICSMSKTERQKLFLSVHPSDLLFILNDHKRIKQELNSFKSNLKMLKERQVVLNNKLMEQQELIQLYKLRDELVRDQNILDKVIYMTEHEINSLRSSELHDQFVDLSTLQKRCLDISTTTLQYRYTQPHIFDVDNLNDYTNELITSTNNKTYQQQQLVDVSIKLKQEIQEIEGYNTNVEQELQQLTQDEQDLKVLISQSFVDNSIPIVDESELQDIQDTVIPKIKILLDDVASCDTEIISLVTIEQLRSTIKELKFTIGSHTSTIERLQRAKQELIRRRSKEAKYKFPMDCDLTCELKTNMLIILKRTDDEISQIDVEIARLKEVVYSDTEVLKIASNEAKNSSLIESFLTQFQLVFKNRYWIDYIFKDKNLVDILSNQPSRIINNILLICKNTEAAKCKAKYEQQLKLIVMKLTTLKNLNLPTQERISKSLIAKQTELDLKTQQYNDLKCELKTLLRDTTIVKTLINYDTELRTLYDQVINSCKVTVIKEQIKLYTTIVSDCTTQKLTINNTLREIESSIAEQESYKIRLDAEILPNIKDIEHKIHQHTQIESALSPTHGIPYQYMRRFLDNLIKNVNKLLLSTCGNELKLDQINSKKLLDFAFNITIRNEHKITDINKCSDGQKQLINLMFNIVIFQQLGLNKHHPMILDEFDSALSEQNRINMLEMLSKLVQQGDLSQLFLVSHFAASQGMANADVVALSETGINLPAIYNEHVVIN